MKSFEQEFKNENGDKIYIRVSYSDWSGKFEVNLCGVKPKGKRNIRWIDCFNDYTFRMAKGEERKKYLFQKWFDAGVTIEMMNEALLKAWEEIKPSPIETE